MISFLSIWKVRLYVHLYVISSKFSDLVANKRTGFWYQLKMWIKSFANDFSFTRCRDIPLPNSFWGRILFEVRKISLEKRRVRLMTLVNFYFMNHYIWNNYHFDSSAITIIWGILLMMKCCYLFRFIILVTC